MTPLPAHRIPLVLALLLTALLGWIYLHRIAANPAKWEEPRRCLVALEMVERGDYVVPRVLGRPYHNKPPLHAWAVAVAAGFRYERVAPVAVRMVSLASLSLICLLLWRMGSSGTQPRSDPLPALIFATTGTVIQFGRVGEIDLFFCGWIFGALACFELGRRRQAAWLQWWLPQVLVGAGVLTKGFAPLLVYPPLLWVAWTMRERVRFSAAWFFLGLLSMVGTVAAWIVPYAIAADLASLRAGWGAELAHVTVGRGAGALLQHLLSYPFVALGIGLPWALLPFASDREGRAAAWARMQSDPWLRLCGVTIVWVFLVYLFVPGTHGRYLMPGLPLLAVWAADLLRHDFVRRSVRRLLDGPRVPMLVAAAGTAYVLIAGAALRERRAEVVFSLVTGAAALLLGLALRRSGATAGPTAALLSVALVYGAATAGVWEGRSAERGAEDERVAAQLAGAIDAALPVVSDGDRGRWLRVGFALSRRIGRVVGAPPLPQQAHYLLRRRQRPHPPRSALLARSGDFAIYRIAPAGNAAAETPESP